MPKAADKALTKNELRDKVRTIILSQGNQFIKELLRKHSIKIGTTKKNLKRISPKPLRAEAHPGENRGMAGRDRGMG